MRNLTITFSHPWLLFLLIPAIALVLIPYFCLSRKYRRTRNRITSMVLHSIVMLLAILVLSGMQFSYQVSNDTNEIIFVVDVSDTEERAKTKRDEFLLKAFDMGQYDGYKMGVVTFGFDQTYAVPLTYEIDTIYDTYLEAELPDTSATDIAAALNYARTLFTNPEFGKIVLVTDGKETDESASAVIRSISTQGITIDTAFISAETEEYDVQVMGITLPDYHVSKEEICRIDILLQSNQVASLNVELYDNGVLNTETGAVLVESTVGEQTVSFRHIFHEQGFHELTVKVSASDDPQEANNSYCTSFYLEVFDKILVLESVAEQSASIVDILSENEEYDLTVFNLNEDNDVPSTLDALRTYDQIILNNISNADLTQNDKLPQDFVEMLYSYVYDIGGGLFTVGGDDEFGEVHAYKREDMYGSLYQQMLPVQAINYTPPVGVVVIVDRSGSMASRPNGGSSGPNLLDWARAGVTSCLDALTERDYFGLMTLDTEYDMILPLTPRTQESKILAALDDPRMKTPNGGTHFAKAIERAGQALRALTSVAKRHIIIVTDGEPNNAEHEVLIADHYKNDTITISVVGIGLEVTGNYTYDTPLDKIPSNGTPYERMMRTVILGHGRLYPVRINEISNIVRLMREDLNAPEIKEVNDEPFKPIIGNKSSSLLDGLEWAEDEDVDTDYMTFELGGFYGVKARNAADVVLIGNYSVPIYAQWKFGKGMVGSFMCDLNGKWSSELLQNTNGQRLLRNIVDGLMPIESIRPKELDVVLKEENYINQISIFTELNSGEYIEGKLVDLSEKDTLSLNIAASAEENISEEPYYVALALDVANNYSRCNFILKKSGVYLLVITKHSSDGTVLATYEAYKEFAYSAEYDAYMEETEKALEDKLKSWATRGQGLFVEKLDEPVEVFEGFITAIDKIADPRIAFLIIAIILFLGDIAVRKFKFKWPHELIRDYKEKKEQKK